MPMQSTSLEQNLRSSPSRHGRTGPSPLALVAALLVVAVAWIHVVDQGGLPGSKTPTYVGVGYYLLELVAVLLAIVLLTVRGRHRMLTWVTAAAVAAGPLVGYILSRGPGLPDYADDRGNWGEPLGLLSLAVEGSLLIVSLVGARLARNDVDGEPR